MKRLIIKEYLKILIIAILLSVVISVVLSFILFFHDRSVDNYMPQYLVRNIRQHINYSQYRISLDAEGLDSLRYYDIWMQVINKNGEVVFEENSKGDLPNKYSLIELTDAVLHSNRLKNYTVYISELHEIEGYAVLLGCDSHIVTKITFNAKGETSRIIFGSILVFCVVTIIVVLCSSYIFSRKITNPVGDIIEDIDKIQKGEELHDHKGKKKSIFDKVFNSITSLETILKQNDILRAEWIINISHDIKSPLSTIRGYSELLYDQDYEYSSSEIKMFAEQILRSEERIQELVDDLKISNSLIEGKVTLHLKKVKIDDVINKCIKNASIYYEHEKQILLDSQCKSEIAIDTKLMERCFTNIICNAFVHNGNDVEVKISITEDDKNTIIQISDNGKGMSDEDVSHIFERYYRGTGAGKTEGTGLGLAIAKEIVSLHGGILSVKSKIGKGIAFTIQLNHL